MTDPGKPTPQPPADAPELAEDATATPEQRVAIELPLEDGDADAQPV